MLKYQGEKMNQDKKLMLICRPEFQGVILICVDRNKMKIRKGHIRLSPNEEAQLLREETEKRRKLRLQQVREQSKENAAKIRQAVKQEKHKQLMKLATDIKDQLEAEKAERVRHLEQQYDNSLRNIGAGHKLAGEQPDWSEERELVQRAENLRAEARGRVATDKHRVETNRRNKEANKVILAKKRALEIEKARAVEVAAMPPPPPDPLLQLEKSKPKPVKVMDMTQFATTHFHMQNEHAVDKADPTSETMTAKEAAELEAERISQRALDLKRLRQDQLERARLRHNQALQKELLKHDYNNILHDLSDLQREDRERRLRIVHSIPKQVYEPPNFRMEDREDRQRQMEQEFEDMYMADTEYLGDLSLALDPQPRELPEQDSNLDLTVTDGGTPLQEPTLPHVPPVLRDMTNMPKPKSPGKKPQKVLRNLMDRIKTQREEWMTSQSLIDVGEGSQQGRLPSNQQQQTTLEPETSGMGQFQPLQPDLTPDTPNLDPAPPAQVAPPQMAPPGYAPPTSAPMVSTYSRPVPMPPDEFAAKLRDTNARQQTNLQLAASQTQSGPTDSQQAELTDILKQQALILEQKRQLELKLQQLTYDQHRMAVTNQMSGQSSWQQAPPQPAAPPSFPTSQFQPLPASFVPPQQIQQQQLYQQAQFPQQPFPQQPFPQPQFAQQQQPLQQQFQQQQPQISQPPPQIQQQQPQSFPQQQQQQQHQQHLFSSMSSSGMSQHPMNSIPPTHTTNTVPMVAGTMGHGQAVSSVRPGYQPPSAVLTADQLTSVSQSYHQQPMVNGYHVPESSLPRVSVSMATTTQVPCPEPVAPSSLTSDAHNDQLKKVREYQQFLLTRHEQSKRVLEDTKAEIKKRRENLLEKYPKLDLSRLEGLGAKYLESQQGTSQASVSMATTARSEGHGQSVPVTSLLASLAAHPYYQATLSQPGVAQQGGSARPPVTTITVGAVQTNGLPSFPDLDSNLKKQNYDNIRKSLPFDGDETLQTPVRVYEAYAQRNLDTTATTDVSETDVSSLTEKGSPALKPAHFKSALQSSGTDTSDMDTSSFLSDRGEVESTLRQDDLQRQLEDIQRQKEEILRRHEMGQQQLHGKEAQLKAKLASVAPGNQEIQQAQQDKLSTVSPAELQQQLRETYRQQMASLQSNQPQLNLSTIPEIDTPISTDTGRHSTDSSEGGATSQRSRTSQGSRGQLREETICEEPRLEAVETQMQSDSKGRTESVAEYSGKHIGDVLERAKRFEKEVLEKLRKQTNAVLFDNEFDDSLEFDVSQRQVIADLLSSGSLTPSSFSTGPLDETNGSKPNDPKSANGSFLSSNSWAQELSKYSIPPSDQSDLSFKVLQSESNRSSLDKKATDKSVFSGDHNRFKVYSTINKTGESDVSGYTEDSSTSDFKSSEKDSATKKAADMLASVNAGDMLRHLQDLQRDLRSGEEVREKMAQKLLEQQNYSSDHSKPDMSEYSLNSDQVSRPFMSDQNQSDLSQYSFTDKSADQSPAAAVSQSKKVEMSHDYIIQSGTSSQEREMPVRKSPIGDHARADSPVIVSREGEKQQETLATEYSFAVADGKLRTTSTPGEDRTKSTLDGMTTGASHSELPSEITINSMGGQARSSLSQSSKVKQSADGRDLTSFTISTQPSDSSTQQEFSTLSSDRHSSSRSNDFSTYSTSTAEESLEKMKAEFQRLVPQEKSESKIKTYAVSRDGDLISEHSDSDKSQSNLRWHDLLSSNNDSTQDKFITGSSESQLTGFTISDSTVSNQRDSQLSSYTNKSSLPSESGESNPKSSSFTTVTSDPSQNMTGASNLSQYTLNENTNLSQYTFPDDSADTGKGNDNGNNYLQQRFASLDNLISESRGLIARHKQVIDTNKKIEEGPKVTLETKSGKDSIQTLDKPVAKPSVLQTVDRSADGAKSFNSTQSKDGNQSSSFNTESLDYLAEHSSGITDEPLPDLTTMTLGSELSISEAFNKTEDLSDSQDSLKSFEKHEMSESEMDQSSNILEDSSQAHSKSDTIQDIVEARRHNFMVQTERIAAASKERALAKSAGGSADEDVHVFRAVPVNIVAPPPKLSMAMNTQDKEKTRAPLSLNLKSGPTQSFTDAKKSFETKEMEMKSPVSSKLPLNRALQPRTPDGSTSKNMDSGMKPTETSSRSKYPTPAARVKAPAASTENKQNFGRVVGEISQFGGSAGLSPKQSPTLPRKTPPKVLPKPVRSKQEEQPVAARTNTGLSKTLSSWKKSRAVNTKPTLPEPSVPKEAPRNSVRVLPQDAPQPLTEEERRQKAEDELYEKNIRAYNPRLFRLQHRLDTSEDKTEPAPKPAERQSKKEF